MKHISLFVHMCSSLKALDVSSNTFPPHVDVAPAANGTTKPGQSDPAELFSKAIAERLAGGTLEELIMAECALTTPAVRRIVDGVTMSGLKRLGLAGNGLSSLGVIYSSTCSIC